MAGMIGISLGLGAKAANFEENSNTIFAKQNKEDAHSSSNHDWIIIPGKRIGPITKNTGYGDLLRFFGKENVTLDAIHVEETFYRAGALIYPQTNNSLAIVWIGDDVEGDIEWIMILGENPTWMTQKGVTVGTTLKELQILNVNEFSFLGGGWDWGGGISSWENGKLQQDCNLKFMQINLCGLEPELSGDNTFHSSHPKLMNTKARICYMRFQF